MAACFMARNLSTPDGPSKTTKRHGSVLPCVGAQFAHASARSTASRGICGSLAKSFGKMDRRARIRAPTLAGVAVVSALGGGGDDLR